MSVSTFEEVTTNRPYKPLLERIKSNAGRNNQGRITTRHRGGGARRMYRIIDFKRNKVGVPAKVTTIEYDPNRSARIALLSYSDGAKRYITAPHGLRIGETLVSGPEAEPKVGNAMPLQSIPLGTMVHNIELQPGRGAQLVRSAGVAAQVMAKDAGYVTVKLPSRRDAPRVGALLCHHRHGRQRRITRISTSARPGARVGWAAGQPFAARP